MIYNKNSNIYIYILFMNFNRNIGKLDIIMGTMFSGKTSYLLNKISLFIELNLKVLYINIDFDDRILHIIHS